MGRLVPLLVVALALAGAGAALAASAGKPQEKHTPADMAKARSVVLRRADFGAGWTAKPSSSGGGTPTCKSFDPDQSDLVETGSADSPEFDKGLRYVSSTAGVFATSAMAQASWNRIVKPGLLDCLASVFSKGANKGGVTTKVTGSGSLRIASLAPRTAAGRITFRTTSKGVTFTGAVDLILLGKGRVDSVMISVWFGTAPAADELRLARLIAGRL